MTKHKFWGVHYFTERTGMKQNSSITLSHGMEPVPTVLLARLARMQNHFVRLIALTAKHGTCF